MSRLLERAVDRAADRLVLLAPGDRRPSGFAHVEADSALRTHLLHEMQRMRGRVYVDDGALSPATLSTDGRHETAQDEHGWHLLALDRAGRVSACAWYLEHGRSVRAEELRVKTCPLVQRVAWRSRVRRAIERDIAAARRCGLRFAEVGGWAVSKDDPSVTDGLLMALSGYALGRIRGGAIGLTTATVRHCSSKILRRIGGTGLVSDGAAIPSYYDPQYGCEMELLRFDSRAVNPDYEPLVERLVRRLTGVLVITADDPSRSDASWNAGWTEEGSTHSLAAAS